MRSCSIPTNRVHHSSFLFALKSLAATLAIAVLAPVNLQAEDMAISVPEGSRFLVHVDLQAFRKTTIGSRLFEMAKEAAMSEIGDDGNFDKIKESIGFDPFTELSAITLMGSDFEDPEDNLQVILQLRKTTGNLEGLMLTLPGYESMEYGRHEIHSAAPDESEKVFAAIHSNKRGIKHIVAARKMKSVTGLLDMLDGKSSARKVKLKKKEREFINVEILELPLEELGDGPQANIAKMVQNVALKMAAAGDDLRLSLTLETKKENQAKQLRQLLQGGIAMFQLVQDGSDEDWQMVQELLSDLEVKRDGTSVMLKLLVPENKIIDLIENEMELSLF